PRPRVARRAPPMAARRGARTRRAPGRGAMTPLYLGWQYATAQPDPGPAPDPPDPRPAHRLSAGWLAAQRREERRSARPARATAFAATALALALAVAAAG